MDIEGIKRTALEMLANSAEKAKKPARDCNTTEALKELMNSRVNTILGLVVTNDLLHDGNDLPLVVAALLYAAGTLSVGQEIFYSDMITILENARTAGLEARAISALAHSFKSKGNA